MRKNMFDLQTQSSPHFHNIRLKTCVQVLTCFSFSADFGNTQKKLRKLLSWAQKPRITKPGSYNPVKCGLADSSLLKKKLEAQIWIFRHTLRLSENARSTKMAVWDFGDVTFTKSPYSPLRRQGHSEKCYTWHLNLGKSWEIWIEDSAIGL